MSMTTDDQGQFTRDFLVSFGAHIGLVLMSLATGKIVHSVFKSNDVEIIKSSVRVDVVGMPKFTVQELKDMARQATPAVPEKSEGPKVETIEKVEVKEDIIKKDDLVIQEVGKVETPKKKPSFLSVISDYSNKKIAPKEQKQGAKDGKSKKSFDTLILEGNRLSQGSALVGDFSDEAASEFGAYVQTLPGIVRQFWKLPTYLLEKNLQCRIRIFLSNSGQILKLDVLESSGAPEYDARAEQAIRSAAPYPKPSEAVATRLTNSGIILGFPL
jgi:colicin import membrane protein